MGILKLAIGVSVLVIGAGYLGRVHPIGDSFAVLRPQAAIAMLIFAGLAALLGRRGVAAVAAVVGCTAILPLAKMYLGQPGGGSFVLYQKNVLFNNKKRADLIADIKASGASVVTLQEVSRVNMPLIADLSQVMPHQLTCASPTSHVAVLTRLPPIPGKSVCAEGLAALQVQGPEGPVWLVSVHLLWPWPFDQATQLETIVPQIANLDGAKVIAGDFNMVRWSTVMDRIELAANGRWAGPVQGSFDQFAPFADLPIDNVLGPFGGRIEIRPKFGSDHNGLVAHLSLSP